MSLIACPECAREISDQAAACPHCGAPARHDAPLVTTQLTAKKFKLRQLVSTVMIIAGVVTMIVAQTATGRLIGGALVLAGLIAYIAARAGAWWTSG